MGGEFCAHWKERNGCLFLGKPEVKGLLGQHRHKWEDDIKIDLQEL